MDVSISRVPVAALIPLRHEVLRTGMPIESAHFPGDGEPTTRHFAAKIGDRIVCCASFMRTPFRGRDAWQLRGMATDPAYQKKGIGTRLLCYAEFELSEQTGVRLFWCNAREPSIGFYRRQGWEVASPIFEIADAGPHRKMAKLV